MNANQETEVTVLQTVAMDERLNVRRRLEQLCFWKQSWEQEDHLLAQRAIQLEGSKYLDIQKGVQIANVRRRLRLNLIKEPIEIAPELVTETSYPILRQKLVQQFAMLTNAERQLWLNNFLFILTPDLRQLNDKIETVRRFRSFGQQRNFLLVGQLSRAKPFYEIGNLR